MILSVNQEGRGNSKFSKVSATCYLIHLKDTETDTERYLLDEFTASNRTTDYFSVCCQADHWK